MKKQSGFTLIELMVVMAIIAILATAGLSAYTGYLKRSRDTVRISQIAQIENIAMSMLSTTGLAPSATDLAKAIYNTNNNKPLKDPLATKSQCSDTADGSMDQLCGGANGYYLYTPCDSGTGFLIGAPYESQGSNINASADNDGITGTNSSKNTYLFNAGSCKVMDGDYSALTAGN